MPAPPAESRATTVGKWLLALVVPASAQALGSVPTEALILMSVLAALSCGLLWLDRDAQTSRASRFVLLAMGVLLGMTILQSIPLPAGVATAIAPQTADIWDRALQPLHEPGPAWHPLSIAPAATHVEVLRGFFYGCVFLAALRVATLEHGERFLIRVVVFSATLMAFSALGHFAVHADKVFGFYRPRELYAYQPGRFSPLLNTNHLAAYLGMGACVALAALLSRQSMPRALSGTAVVVLAATSLWQSSRGAAGSLLFGIVLTFALTFYVRRRFESARAEGAILAACALAATVIVTIAVSSASAHLLSQDLTKVTVARSSMKLVAASPWFGFGRGGFETVFSSVREATNYVTFTNPEDFVVQWLVEWGVPASLLGAGLLGWALRPQVVLRAVRPAVGAWVAIVVGVLHELVDYHFEIPGVVALVALCVAIVVSGRARSRGAAPLAATSSARFSAVAVVLGTIAAAIVVWPDHRHMLAQERRRLSQDAVARTVSAVQFKDELRASMLRYPAEPFFPLMGAVRAQSKGEGSVVPWIARSLERNPRFGRAHFVLAQSLGARHPAQARLEYRLAYENDAILRDPVVKEALPLIDDATSAQELVPDGPAGVAMLDALVAALAARLPSTAVILDEEMERRAPGLSAPFRRRVERIVDDAVNGAPWCGRESRCAADALAAADDLARREPEKCHSHVLVAQVRIAQKEVAPALDGLERAMDVVSDRGECQRQLILLSLQTGQTMRGDMALERIVRGGCGAIAECEDLYRWAAGVEEGRGHYARAVRLYKLAMEQSNESNDALLEHIGAMGDKDGVLADALEAYGTLARRHPSEPQWQARMSELRERSRPRTPPPAPEP